MRIETLLLTRDLVLQRAVERSAQEFAIEAEHHTSGPRVLQRIAEWKFAAVIADCDHDEGLALLEATRLEPRNRNTIAIAASRPGLRMSVPFRSGANFVLEKPVTRERVSRLLRAAYSLIAHEHFRYLRHPMSVPVNVFFGGQSLQAKSRNVSTRGFGLHSSLLAGWPSFVRLQFRLDGVPIQTDAEVIWSDSSGRAGLRLQNFPSASQRAFDLWIAARTEFLTSGLVRPPHRAYPAQGYPDAACY